MTMPVEASRVGEEKPFLDHLEDLRQTFLHCLAALVIGMLIALPLVPYILGLLTRPLSAVVGDPAGFLRSMEVAGAFVVALRIALWSGLLLSSPFLLFFIGGFVFPGLTLREKQVIMKSAGLGVILFFLGVCMAYFITLPVAVRMMFRMHGWLGVQAVWTVTSYVAFAIQVLIAFGLVFEMPVVLLVLGRLGIISARQLREKRKYVIVIAFVVAMVLTPPDVFTQLMMAFPLVGLYEICIWIVWFWEKGGRRRS